VPFVSKRAIDSALKAVKKEISNNAAGGSMYARGLANEGYAEGYAAALSDVLLLAHGSVPTTRGYWQDCESDHASSANS
jgi:hypothetical protein